MHTPNSEVVERPSSNALSAKTVEALQLRHALDKWVCDFHLYLTVGAGIIFGAEFAVGAAFCFLEWSTPENKAIRVFLIMRLLAYCFVIQSSRQELRDYEPAHPGMHMTWTLIHAVCIVTVSASSQHTFKTWQSIIVAAMLLIDNGLLVVTWWGLRRVRQRISRHISSGEIDSIHEATWRYLDFIPPNRPKDSPSARHLLWAGVQRFEDVSLDAEDDAYLVRRREEAATSAAAAAAAPVAVAGELFSDDVGSASARPAPAVLDSSIAYRTVPAGVVAERPLGSSSLAQQAEETTAPRTSPGTSDAYVSEVNNEEDGDVMHI